MSVPGGGERLTRTVVIADDEPHLRLLIEMSLEPLAADGIRTVAVGDGTAALETIRRERQAVAVLDLMLPGMTGVEICSAVKSDADLRQSHVIILTAKGQELDRRLGAEAGADDYMTKPFDPDELLETVRAALDRA